MQKTTGYLWTQALYTRPINNHNVSYNYPPKLAQDRSAFFKDERMTEKVIIKWQQVITIYETPPCNLLLLNSPKL